LVVLHVEPSVDGSLLRASVDPGLVAPDLAMSALHAARRWLRQEIAQAIQRKRTPNLRFIIAPHGALPDEGSEVAT
jgi:ribosome-binding factor A